MLSPQMEIMTPQNSEENPRNKKSTIGNSSYKENRPAQKRTDYITRSVEKTNTYKNVIKKQKPLISLNEELNSLMREKRVLESEMSRLPVKIRKHKVSK